jgi:hypothetical protein
METSKRRSRMHRVSAGKRIELTDRDMELFKLLNRYRYLRSNFLYSFLGGNSETRFKERLGHLYHDGRHINRPAQQWQFANCRHMPLIYELDEKGDSNAKDVQRADIKIVPDALFGLEYTVHGQKSYRFFVLEADRNQMPVARSNLRQSSYLRKILAYRAIAAQNIYKSHLGIPNFLVLNVITNDRHMKSIMALLDELTAKKGSQMFLFKSISTLGDFRIAPVPTSHVLTAPWKRVGHDDFCINKT